MHIQQENCLLVLQLNHCCIFPEQLTRVKRSYKHQLTNLLRCPQAVFVIKVCKEAVILIKKQQCSDNLSKLSTFYNVIVCTGKAASLVTVCCMRKLLFATFVPPRQLQYNTTTITIMSVRPCTSIDIASLSVLLSSTY
jgi:hypothetical protein